MNNLYICGLNPINGKHFTSRLMTDKTAQEFYDEMADAIREQEGVQFVYVTNIRPLTSEGNKVMCDHFNNGLPKIFG